MENYVCTGCGTQFDPSSEPPRSCPVCDDDRQYVPASGQTWTTHRRLAGELKLRIESDSDLLGIGVQQDFAIPQRALLLRTDIGNVLWDCVPVITEAGAEQIAMMGGLDLIVISHPHFYSAMVEWSDRFGARVLLHGADRDWVRRHSPAIDHWTGEHLQLSTTLRLLHLPGHFPGSCALHWSGAPNDRRVLLVGDTLHVGADKRHVAVMHSVPNYIPVGPNTIDTISSRLEDVPFDDLYGFTWGLNIIGDADIAVTRSLRRYRQHIRS